MSSSFTGMDRPAFLAGGNISPCTIVQLSAAADFTVLASNATAVSFGIAQEGTDAAPISGASTKAAVSGEEVRVFMAGEVALCVVGSNITTGSLVVADANAAAAPTIAYNSSTPQYVIGSALTGGIVGDKIPILIHPEVL